MIALLAAFLIAQGEVDHTFTYQATEDLKSVNLAGTFNGWNKEATPLKADGRKWSATVHLKPGKIQYKFVLNGSKWVQDPSNPKTADDLNGGFNSYLLILPGDYDRPAAKGDGVIARSALLHEPNSPSYLDFDDGRLWFSLRLRPNDVAHVSVMLGEDKVPMSPLSGDELYELDRAGIAWDGKKKLDYTFLLEDGPTKLWFGPNGFSDSPEGNRYHLDFKSLRTFEAPKWPEQSVTYQIFPDRFDNGDTSNDPKDVQPWNAKPTYWNHFGGDAAGVRKHIGYLKSLGIKSVYFNPVFKARSNHRYDSSDYYQIDPEIGTNEEFGDLTRALKRIGIRTVLDGVFNHTAPEFFAFQDIIKNGQDSKYKDWYFIKSYPVTVKDPPPYVAWFGFAGLPKVNQKNPDARKYFLGVPEFWDSRAEVAGWRLDVPNEIQDDYWYEFRKIVKSNDPDRWIVGEIWSDGNHWLQGDMFDSIMGYQFRFSTVQFVANQAIGPTEYMNQVMGVYASYAPQVSRNLMNLLDSHDTVRFLTVCKGDKRLAQLGAVLQLTWVGAPCVYYGDELGMEGDKDPDNRRPMRWDWANEDNPTLRFYKTLIAARNKSRALQSGAPVVISTNDADGTLVFARALPDDVALVAVNRSDKERSVTVDLSRLEQKRAMFREVFSGETFTANGNTLAVKLQPFEAAVLLPVHRQKLDGGG